MRTDDLNELFDKDLEGLDHHEPSMRFAKNVVEQVKAETDLLKPQRGPMYWIPKLCVAGFGLAFMIFLLVLLSAEISLDLDSITRENRQMVVAVFGVGLAIPAFVLLDRLLKKMMLQ